VGTVVSLGFFKDTPDTTRIQEVRDRFAAFGAPVDLVEKITACIKSIKDEDRQHFFELVELVAQEIVTLHLEISSRENRITELNNELGVRYKYDNMIGKSKPMQELYSLLDKIKSAESTV